MSRFATKMNEWLPTVRALAAEYSKIPPIISYTDSADWARQAAARYRAEESCTPTALELRPLIEAYINNFIAHSTWHEIEPMRALIDNMQEAFHELGMRLELDWSKARGML